MTSPKTLSRSAQLASALMFEATGLIVEAGGSIRLQELLQKLPSKLDFDDWATQYMESNGLTRWQMFLQFYSVNWVKAGFLLKERGVWRLTEQGVAARQHGAEKSFYTAQQAFKNWKKQQLKEAGASTQGIHNKPLETEDTETELPASIRMDSAIRDAHENLAADLISSIKSCSPLFFEKLVIDLLQTMGYGGSRSAAGRVVGKSGDEGIDGIIDEDRLGLDAIYLQAKRWEGVVGRPEIMKFVGALAGQRATKGVFITTSAYTREAVEYAKSSQYKIVLIDGARLAELMIEHNLGVSVAATYELKRIDTDFFNDE